MPHAPRPNAPGYTRVLLTLMTAALVIGCGLMMLVFDGQLPLVGLTIGSIGLFVLLMTFIVSRRFEHRRARARGVDERRTFGGSDHG